MKKKWIVKIKNEIQGPFTLEELKKMVLQKKLSARDEVIIPQKSWVYAYTIPELCFDFDQTQTVTSIKDSSSDSSYTDLEDVEKNSFQEDFENSSSSLPVEEVEYVSFEDDKKSTKKSFPTQFEDAQKLSHNLKSSHLSQTLWQALVVVSLIAGFIWLNRQKTKPVQETSLENIYQSLSQARGLFKVGMYQKSLEIFQSIVSKDESLLGSSDWIYLSELSVQSKNLYEARKFLNKAQIFQDVDSQRASLLKGVIEFSDGNYSQALNFFKKNSSPSSLAYQFIVHLIEQNLQEAQNILNRFKNSNSLENFLSLVGTEFFFLGDSLLMDEGFMELFQGEYKQEASFVRLLAGLKQNTFPDAEKEIQEFLNQDPYITQEFHVDLLSPAVGVIWKYLLLDSCENWFQQVGETAYFLSLYAFCQIKSGLKTQAQDSIQRSIHLYPKNSLVLSVYFYVMSVSFPSSSQYQIYIDRALSSRKENFDLPFILKARSCQKNGDYDCAYKNWQRVSSQNLYSEAGSSWALYFLGDKTQAFERATLGVKKAPSYLPFQQILFLNKKENF